jgi:hypothetical protein
MTYSELEELEEPVEPEFTESAQDDFRERIGHIRIPYRDPPVVELIRREA